MVIVPPGPGPESRPPLGSHRPGTPPTGTMAATLQPDDPRRLAFR